MKLAIFNICVLIGIFLGVFNTCMKLIKAHSLNHHFRRYTLSFLVVFFVYTSGLIVALNSYHPSTFYGFSILLGLLWAFGLNSFDYVRALYPREKKKNHWPEAYTAFKQLAILMLITFCFSCVCNLLVYLFSLCSAYCLKFCLKNQIDLGTIQVYLYSLNFAFLYISLTFLIFFGFWANKKLLASTTNQSFGYHKSFYDSQSLKRLKLFFRLNPQAKNNVFVAFLAFLSWLRIISFIIPAIAVISIRFGSGCMISLLIWVYFLITYVVTTPQVLNYMRSNYGHRALKLLGWNTPEINLSKAGKYGVMVAVAAKSAQTAWKIHSDTSEAVQRATKAYSAGQATIVEDNVQTRIDSNRREIWEKSKSDELARRERIAVQTGNTLEAEAKAERLQKIQDLVDGKKKK